MPRRCKAGSRKQNNLPFPGERERDRVQFFNSNAWNISNNTRNRFYETLHFSVVHDDFIHCGGILHLILTRQKQVGEDGGLDRCSVAHANPWSENLTLSFQLTPQISSSGCQYCSKGASQQLFQKEQQDQNKCLSSQRPSFHLQLPSIIQTLDEIKQPPLIYQSPIKYQITTGFL